jgi:hypothetical protein
MREGAIPSLPSRAEVEVAELLPEGTRLKPRPGGSGGKPARCESCEYDIAGQSLGDACPECGNLIVPTRFAGAWCTPSGRRRFRMWVQVLLAGVALHTIAAAMVLLDLWNLGVPNSAVFGGSLMVSLALIPSAMIGLSVGSADASRRRWIPVAAAGLRIAAPAMLVLSGLLALRSRSWIEVAVISVVLADGVSAWSVAGFTRGTTVRPVVRRRHQALVALSAVSVVVALNSNLIAPPKFVFLISATVLIWTALEIRGIARRMRALEPA